MTRVAVLAFSLALVAACGGNEADETNVDEALPPAAPAPAPPTMDTTHIDSTATSTTTGL